MLGVIMLIAVMPSVILLIVTAPDFPLIHLRPRLSVFLLVHLEDVSLLTSVTWGLYYKTFYSRNYFLVVISLTVRSSTLV